MVTKEMIIRELLEYHEDVAEILLKAGMHCVGCPSAASESLEEAGLVHGLDVDEIVNEINALKK